MRREAASSRSSAESTDTGGSGPVNARLAKTKPRGSERARVDDEISDGVSIVR